jgi:hypothetical protein
MINHKYKAGQWHDRCGKPGCNHPKAGHKKAAK